MNKKINQYFENFTNFSIARNRKRTSQCSHVGKTQKFLQKKLSPLRLIHSLDRLSKRGVGVEAGFSYSRSLLTKEYKSKNLGLTNRFIRHPYLRLVIEKTSLLLL